MDKYDSEDAFLQWLDDEQNSKPNPETANLSAFQVFTLIDFPLDDDLMNPIRLNKELKPADVEHSRLLFNIRTLLTILMSPKGNTTTANGNLTRKVVKELSGKMKFREGYLDEWLRYRHLFNEQDIPELHFTRIIAECAELISTTKNRFLVQEKAHTLLKTENAGQLYHLLFLTYFRVFNLACRDRAPACDSIQRTCAYSLYRLQELGDEWLNKDDLYLKILLPTVREEIEKVDSWAVGRPWFVESRIVKPLLELGLLECVYVEKKLPNSTFKEIDKVKKSCLFDKFISFKF